MSSAISISVSLSIEVLGSGAAAAPAFDRYVDSANGDDAADGLTAATAFATLARAVSAAAAGDRIGLARGSVWREPGLDFALAGATIAAYGSGPKPRISCGELVGPWVEDVVSPASSSGFEAGAPDAYWTTAGGSDSTAVADGGHTRHFATAGADVFLGRTPNNGFLDVQFTLWLDPASAAADGQHCRCVVFEGAGWNSANMIAVWLRRSGGGFWLDLNRGSASTSSFRIVPGTPYAVRVVVAAGNGSGQDRAALYVDGAAVKTLAALTLSGPCNSNLRLGLIGWNVAGFAWDCGDLRVYHSDSDAGVSGLWSAPWTSDVQVLTCDLGRGRRQASRAECAAAGDHFWEAGTSRLWLRADADPNAMEVEVGVRSKLMNLGQTDAVTIRDVAFSHCNHAGDSALAVVLPAQGGLWDGIEVFACRFTGAFCQAADAVIRNARFADCDNLGLDIDSGSGILVEDCSFENCGYGGVFAGALVPPIASFTLRRSTVSCDPARFCANGVLVDNASSGLVEDVTIAGAQYNGLYVKGNSSGATGITARRVATSGIFNGYGFHVQKDGSAGVDVALIDCTDSGSHAALRVEGGATAEITGGNLAF